MDNIIITAAVVLAVVALIEIVTIFFSLPGDNAPPYVMVLPVFSNDELFTARLEFLTQKGCGRNNIILVDYTADNKQKEICRRFVLNNPDAAFITSAELEKYLEKIFSVTQKNS